MLRLNLLLLIVAVICTQRRDVAAQGARLFQALESEQERAEHLDVEFGQLQLELSTWATSPRIERSRGKTQDAYPEPASWSSSPRRGVAMMNFKGPKGHKFAESPVLKLRLPAWRSRLMAL